MRSIALGRGAAGAALVALATAGLVAWSSSDDGAGQAGGTYDIWDPYPQFDQSSEWVSLLTRCGTEAGVTVARTGYDTTELTNRALLAAQQGNSPDVLIVDNPVVSTLAEAGVLTTTEENDIDVSAFAPNLLGAGQRDGQTYGVPIGANTLALYYNRDLLADAGVDVTSVTDWESLTAALAADTAAGGSGITFSAIGTEEGSFQFLPWFWGAGGDLTRLDSPAGVSALALWTDWLAQGYAPNSVINNTQTTSWQEFATGEYAFAENGTWQLSNAEQLDFAYGIIAIPAAGGGSAPAPTGGEFVAVPVQADTERYAVSRQIVDCLTSTDNLLTTVGTLSYVAPTEAAQDRQVAERPELQVWVDAVRVARGRTVQAALSGAKDPQQALTDAQSAAATQ
jgi:multiple sugar transport system substrate-binding protein